MSHESREQKTFSVWLRFGTPGHEGEYVLNLENHDIEKPIPGSINSELRQELGSEWDVANRGSRIEITNMKKYGHRDDEKVQSAVKKVLEPRGYQMK